MKARIISILVALGPAMGGCGSAGTPSAISTDSPAASPSLSAALSSPPAGTPKPTPAPTLVSTSEKASQAPPDAVSIDMGAFGPPRFTPDQVTAKAGEVVFFLKNVGDQYEGYHDFVIGPVLYQGLARSPTINGGESVIFTIEDLPAGIYAFWCEVEQHASLGMVGALTVEP